MLTRLRAAGRHVAEQVPPAVRSKIYVGAVVVAGAAVVAGQVTESEAETALDAVAVILGIGAPLLAAGNVPRDEG